MVVILRGSRSKKVSISCFLHMQHMGQIDHSSRAHFVTCALVAAACIYTLSMASLSTTVINQLSQLASRAVVSAPARGITILQAASLATANVRRATSTLL